LGFCVWCQEVIWFPFILPVVASWSTLVVRFLFLVLYDMSDVGLHLPICLRLFSSSLFCSVDVFLLIIPLLHCCFHCCLGCFQLYSKSSYLIKQSFLFKKSIAIVLDFHINFRSIFSGSMKMALGILNWIDWDLWINSGENDALFYTII
jgi:hypothetical protein